MPHKAYTADYNLARRQYSVYGLLDTAYWLEIMFALNVDQSIIYGISANVDTAYYSKSSNGLEFVQILKKRTKPNKTGQNRARDQKEHEKMSLAVPSDLIRPAHYEAFYFDDDHIEEKSSSSTTTHSDISLSKYDSFVFDLSNDPFPPADRSDFHHEEFADELAHIISLPDYDCFYFKSEPDPGELTSIVDSVIHENVSSTTNVNLRFEDDQSPLLAYVVWIFLPFLTYPVTPPYLLSCGNEDTIFDPGISVYHSFMPSVSHRSGTFMKFNVYPNHLNESTDIKEMDKIKAKTDKAEHEKERVHKSQELSSYGQQKIYVYHHHSTVSSADISTLSGDMLPHTELFDQDSESFSWQSNKSFPDCRVKSVGSTAPFEKCCEMRKLDSMSLPSSGLGIPCEFLLALLQSMRFGSCLFEVLCSTSSQRHQNKNHMMSVEVAFSKRQSE
ncbi:hypothetical protein Tco_0682010 [Tanacetum coccineum]|uniref:Uncharacterized protein n=1 Tax=Tanacetum coccineum TaxID=301880 RepID=A0ABQ4XQU5_9ASTR